MKISYIILYIISAVLLLIALLGNSTTKPLFNKISEKTLSLSGFDKSYLESADNQIDELIYKSKQIELQIEKIKKFFSSDKVDENLYKKEKNLILERTFYDPLIMLFNYFFRISFVFIAVIFFMGGMVFHLGYRSMDLRRRVKRLESLLPAANDTNFKY
ncbi:MAG: hypothetical protein R2942_04225 [Ignavibacteria bacterium]|nr:hypothetical protein [Ignavibacteriota bacterium]